MKNRIPIDYMAAIRQALLDRKAANERISFEQTEQGFKVGEWVINYEDGMFQGLHNGELVTYDADVEQVLDFIFISYHLPKKKKS